MHGGVALAGTLIGLLAWQSATAIGIVGLGPAVIAVGLYAAHFFDLPAARGHVAFLVLLTTAGAVAARPDGFAAAWITVVVSAVALTAVQGRLARSLPTAATTDPLTGVRVRALPARHRSRRRPRGPPAARRHEPLRLVGRHRGGAVRRHPQLGSGPRRRRPLPREAQRPHRLRRPAGGPADAAALRSRYGPGRPHVRPAATPRCGGATPPSGPSAASRRPRPTTRR